MLAHHTQTLVSGSASGRPQANPARDSVPILVRAVERHRNAQTTLDFTQAPIFSLTVLSKQYVLVHEKKTHCQLLAQWKAHDASV